MWGQCHVPTQLVKVSCECMRIFFSLDTCLCAASLHFRHWVQFGSVDSLSILCGPDPDAELSQSIISTVNLIEYVAEIICGCFDVKPALKLAHYVTHVLVSTHSVRFCAPPLQLMYGSLLLEGITICVSWFNRPMHLRVVSVSSGSASLCRSGASTRVRVCPPPPPSLSPHWRERSLAECPGAEDTVERLVDALSITSEGFTGAHNSITPTEMLVCTLRLNTIL